MPRLIAGFLLVIGCVWGACVGLAFLSMRGMSSPASEVAVISLWGLMLIGPAAMILGSVLVVGGGGRTGVILIELACLILTGFVIYSVLQDLHPQPLEASSPYALYAVAVVVVILVDAAAIRLHVLKAKRESPSISLTK